MCCKSLLFLDLFWWQCSHFDFRKRMGFTCIFENDGEKSCKHWLENEFCILPRVFRVILFWIQNILPRNVLLVLCRIQETIETVKLQHLCSVWLVPPLVPIKLLYRPFRAIFHRQYYFKLPACVSMIGHIPAAERYKIPKDVFTPFFYTYVWFCGSTRPRVFWGRNTELSFLAQSIGIWISSLNYGARQKSSSLPFHLNKAGYCGLENCHGHWWNYFKGLVTRA